MKPPPSRRRVIAGLALAAPALALGYAFLPPPRKLIKHYKGLGETLSYRTSQLIGRNALAREYRPDQRSPVFPTNGSVAANSPGWQVDAEEGFANWHLPVEGLVHSPRRFSLAEIRAFPSRTQITRHDCVEGWSAIAKWTGVPLNTVLDAVGLRAEARYVVFWCADILGGLQYYESIDMIDAFHPQTILAYGMNDRALPIPHGAPLRLRVERQLGYKHAKFLHRIELVADLESVGLGNGGFWEDLGGYEWYAGI